MYNTPYKSGRSGRICILDRKWRHQEHVYTTARFIVILVQEDLYIFVYSVKKWKRNTNGLFSDAKDKYIRRVRITEFWSLICCAFFVIWCTVFAELILFRLIFNTFLKLMNAQLNLPLIQNHCWNQVLSEFCMGFELERYQGATYWRRMETEALCLVGKIYPIPCRASCFASVNLEETVEFILFLQIDRGKTVSAARNWTNFAPQADATTLAFASVSILLLWSHPISHTTFPI